MVRAMTTLLISHPDCLGHVTPEGHPEQVARLTAILEALDPIEGLARADAPLAQDAHLLRAHPQSHIDAISAAAPAQGQVPLDADTWMSPGSLAAARRAAGGVVEAVDKVMTGEAKNAFVAVRPPGHHAEASKPMGFCLFGNIVVGAKHALDAHQLKRVAIVDFDVHHGNGTQDLVWDDARILFASTHQSPLYPGTGYPHETGAHGNVINVQLSANAGGTAFRHAVEGMILPAVDAFEPEMVLISAGFDAHADDPLANLNLTEDDFGWVTGVLCDLAERHANGRVVSVLEGGYNLDALARSAVTHVQKLMEYSE